MKGPALIRAGGLVAIAGGALRATASFAPVLVHSDVEREWLYIAIDACLTIGLVSFHARHARRVGWPGAAGLAFALAGIATVRANRLLSTVDLYPAGALAIVCGAILLTAGAWAARRISGWIPAAFLLSTLAGIIGNYVPGGNALFVWSGVIFGVAFVSLGVTLRKPSSDSDPPAAYTPNCRK